MSLTDGFNVTATGLEPKGVEREIRLKIYRFNAPENASGDDELMVDFANAEYVHEQVFHSDREFSAALEFVASRERTHVPMYSLEGQDLSGMDLSHLDLSGFNFRDCNLTDTDLSGSRLHGCDFTGAKMEKALLNDVIGGWMLTSFPTEHPKFRFSPVCLDDAVLENASLRGGAFQGASFRGTQMQNSRMDSALIKDSDFSGADMTGASMKKTYISGVNFMEAKVSVDQLADANGTPLCQPGHYACAFNKRKRRAHRPA